MILCSDVCIWRWARLWKNTNLSVICFAVTPAWNLYDYIWKMFVWHSCVSYESNKTCPDLSVFVCWTHNSEEKLEACVCKDGYNNRNKTHRSHNFVILHHIFVFIVCMKGTTTRTLCLKHGYNDRNRNATSSSNLSNSCKNLAVVLEWGQSHTCKQKHVCSGC